MNALASLFNSLPGTAGQGLIRSIMAIGVYITYKILDMTGLTVNDSLATDGAVAILYISMGWDPWLAVLVVVLTGMLAGLTTGVLYTACGIPVILAGVLTQLALYPINLRITTIRDESATTKVTLAVSVDKNDLLLSSRCAREPALNNPLLLLMLLTAVVITLLCQSFDTEQGSAPRTTGIDQSVARTWGINTNIAKTLDPVVSNGLVTLAGGLLAQYRGSATIDTGCGAIVVGLVVVIIGEVLLDKIFRSPTPELLSAVIGAIICYVVIIAVLRLGLEFTDLKLLTALVVAVFPVVPYWKGRYFTKFTRKEGASHT